MKEAFPGATAGAPSFLSPSPKIMSPSSSSASLSKQSTVSSNFPALPSSSTSSSHAHHHRSGVAGLPNPSSTNQACAACKYQRRKCQPQCVLAPYFPADQQQSFLNAHRLFGVSNILKTLKSLDPSLHGDAMRSIIFHSNARAQDPVYGCYRHIINLQQQILQHSQEYQIVSQQLAAVREHLQQLHFPHHQQQQQQQQLLQINAISDFEITSCLNNNDINESANDGVGIGAAVGGGNNSDDVGEGHEVMFLTNPGQTDNGMNDQLHDEQQQQQQQYFFYCSDLGCNASDRIAGGFVDMDGPPGTSLVMNSGTALQQQQQLVQQDEIGDDKQFAEVKQQEYFSAAAGDAENDEDDLSITASFLYGRESKVELREEEPNSIEHDFKGCSFLSLANCSTPPV